MVCLTVDQFLANGGTIKRGKYHAPRANEKTFKAQRGSVFNMGAKAITLSTLNVNKRKHG